MDLTDSDRRQLQSALMHDVARKQVAIEQSDRLLAQAERDVLIRRQLRDKAVACHAQASKACAILEATSQLAPEHVRLINQQTCLVVGSARFGALADLGLVNTNGWTDLGNNVLAWTAERKAAA